MVHGPFYSWIDQSDARATDESIVNGVRLVLQAVQHHGPFDGIYGFSNGAYLLVPKLEVCLKDNLQLTFCVRLHQVDSSPPSRPTRRTTSPSECWSTPRLSRPRSTSSAPSSGTRTWSTPASQPQGRPSSPPAYAPRNSGKPAAPPPDTLACRPWAECGGPA